MADFPVTEQEERLEALFSGVRNQLRGLEELKDVGKQNAVLENVKGKIQDARALIKEFEREARTDGIPSKELSKRKTDLVNELNSLIALRKNVAAAVQSRQELLKGAQNDGGVPVPTSPEHMTTQQIVATGRKEIQEIDNRLARAEKVVDDTIQIGVQTAAELAEQTKQMEKIVDDLDDIEFSMKKARQVLRDITRGLLTDKFIVFLSVLIAIAVVVVIVLKIVDNDDDSFPKPRELGGNRRLQADLSEQLHHMGPCSH